MYKFNHFYYLDMSEKRSIVDCNLDSIPHENNLIIRTVGLVRDIDQSETFTLSNKNGQKITCLPSPDFVLNLQNGDFVTVVGHVLLTDQNEIELRVESAEKITEKEYLNFDKYLKIRHDLLNYGNRNI